MLQKTLKYFYEISKIPRASGKENLVCDWIISWAQNNNYEFKKDKISNIIIDIPATLGQESKDCIVLQGHLDMVCVKSKESNHNFDNDSIDIIQKDGFLLANNTTLGADNGIGVALALACSELHVHPSLQLLFTIDEEQGMTGVLNMEKGFITGNKLINLDSEQEGFITIGSAALIKQTINGKFEINDSNKQAYKFNINGIKGGHSGLEIDKSKGNAIDCFFALLDYLGIDFELSNIKSGFFDNAIPKELEANLVLGQVMDLENKVSNFVKEYKTDYKENNLNIIIKKINKNIQTIGTTKSNNIKKAIIKSKSGIYKMSKEIKGFVISSQNIGIMNLDNGILEIKYLLRSSLDSDLNNLAKQNENAFGKFVKVNSSEQTPTWLEKPNSVLLKKVKNIYEKVIGKQVDIVGIHAGLECGSILSLMPKGSEAISIGPNIYGAHTIDEKCEIESIGVLGKILKGLLKNF